MLNPKNDDPSGATLAEFGGRHRGFIAFFWRRVTCEALNHASLQVSLLYCILSESSSKEPTSERSELYFAPVPKRSSAALPRLDRENVFLHRGEFYVLTRMVDPGYASPKKQDVVRNPAKGAKDDPSVIKSPSLPK